MKVYRLSKTYSAFYFAIVSSLSLLCFLILAIFAFGSDQFTDLFYNFFILIFIFLFFGLIFFELIIRYRNTYIILNKEGLIFSRGSFLSTKHEIPYNMIYAVEDRKNFLDYVLNNGTLIIKTSTDLEIITIRNLSKAQHARAEIMALMPQI